MNTVQQLDNFKTLQEFLAYVDTREDELQKARCVLNDDWSTTRQRRALANAGVHLNFDSIRKSEANLYFPAYAKEFQELRDLMSKTGQNISGILPTSRPAVLKMIDDLKSRLDKTS